MKQYIGRRSIYGNPIRASATPGATLPFFEAYWQALLNGDENQTIQVLREASAQDFTIDWDQHNSFAPPDDRAAWEALYALNPSDMHCPGCRNLTNSATCHGSILLKLKALHCKVTDPT